MAASLSPKELVEALYTAIKDKNFDAIREVCDPEIDWIQTKGFPGGGRRHGVEEVISKVVQGLGREWEVFVFHPSEVIAAGETVVVLGQYRGRHRSTGNKLEAAGAHVFNIKDRKIARFRQYADTFEIVKAMKPLEDEDSPE